MPLSDDPHGYEELYTAMRAERDARSAECELLRGELTDIKKLLGITGPTDIGDVFDAVGELRAALVGLRHLSKTEKNAALWTPLERKIFEIVDAALRGQG